MNSIKMERITFIFLFLLQSTITFSQGGEVITFSTPPPGSGFSESNNYSVEVNGTKVFARKLSTSSDAWFAFTGKVEVEITVSENISSYELSPHSADLNPVVNGNTIKFMLDCPRKLLLHKVNSLNEVLAIWADAPEENVPDAAENKVVSLDEHGIIAGTTNDLTSDIQRVINKVPPGGTLYIPYGNYKFRHLTLKTNMSIYFEPGAVIEMIDDDPNYSGLEGEGTNNVKIYGRGTINGNGHVFSGGSDGNKKSRIIRIAGSNCTYKDFCIREAQHWTWMTRTNANTSKDSWFYNCKILNSPDGYNRDGIDPNDCERCLLEDLFIKTTDDCHAINTNTQPKRLDIIIRNGVYYNSGRGTNLKIGPYWKADGGGVWVENMDFIQAPRNISIWQEFGAYEQYDINLRNIRCEDAFDNLFTTKDVLARNVRIDHLYSGHNKPSYFDAHPDGGFHEITFNQFNRQGKIINSFSEGGFSGNTSGVIFEANPLPLVSLKPIKLYGSPESPASFEVKLDNGARSSPITVKYLISGSALPEADYIALPGTVVIPADLTSVTVPVNFTSVLEQNEFKTVHIRMDIDSSYLTTPHYQTVITSKANNSQPVTSVDDVSMTNFNESSEAANSVSSEKNDIFINAYPNPAKNILNIAASNTITSAEMMDISGKCILRENVNSMNFTVNISDIATGVYFMHLQFAQNIKVCKIIIE